MAEEHKAEELRQVDLRVAWEGVEEAPILFVNQFMGLVGADEVFLLLGQVSPPAVLGTAEEQAEQLGQLSHIPINTVARLGLTRSRCEQLVSVLNQTIENYDKGQPGAGLREGDEE